MTLVEKAGNLTIEEEDVVRLRLDEMEEAEEKEQANDRGIEEKIKVQGGTWLLPCTDKNTLRPWPCGDKRLILNRRGARGY